MASLSTITSGPVCGLWAKTSDNQCIGLVADDNTKAVFLAIYKNTSTSSLPFAIASSADDVAEIQLPGADGTTQTVKLINIHKIAELLEKLANPPTPWYVALWNKLMKKHN